MPHRVVRNAAGVAAVNDALTSLRAKYGLTRDFPEPVLAEAKRAADRSGSEEFRAEFVDRTEVPFVTIDPESSRDLDQAVHFEREGAGYLVRYAISAVGRFVEPGGVLEAEIERRGQTVYGPDFSVPLHPEVLSHGAASLLPGEVRPAYVWYHHLDPEGVLRETWVELAVVKSVAKLSYAGVQSAYDAGAPLPFGVPSDFCELFREVGTRRIACEARRGGISLNLPEQVVEEGASGYQLCFRSTTEVENWNAQISLLTGMAAASLMIRAGVGVLRTMPEASPVSVAALRSVAKALHLEWPETMGYAEFLRSVSSETAAGAAFLTEAVSLFRGAGYATLPISGDRHAHMHAAVAAPYAHVTAPLRRLVDRYGLEVCLCICSGRDIPEWVTRGLATVSERMAATSRVANGFERETVNIVEALVLNGREGETFEGVVVDVMYRRRGSDDTRNLGTVQLREPAVQAVVTGAELTRGREVRVTLVKTDVGSGVVEFKAN